MTIPYLTEQTQTVELQRAPENIQVLSPAAEITPSPYPHLVCNCCVYDCFISVLFMGFAQFFVFVIQSVSSFPFRLSLSVHMHLLVHLSLHDICALSPYFSNSVSLHSFISYLSFSIPLSPLCWYVILTIFDSLRKKAMDKMQERRDSRKAREDMLQRLEKGGEKDGETSKS